MYISYQRPFRPQALHPGCRRKDNRCYNSAESGSVILAYAERWQRRRFQHKEIKGVTVAAVSSG